MGNLCLIKHLVLNIKVAYKLERHGSVLDFAGLHRISGFQALIQLSGMPAKCLGCGKFGHVRKFCSKCSKCNTRGHNAEQCGKMSTIVAQNNAMHDDIDNGEEVNLVGSGVMDASFAEDSGEDAVVAKAGA